MKTIKFKLMVIIITFMTISLGGLSFLNYYKANQMLTENLELSIKSLTISSGKEVGLWLDARKTEMELIANSPITANVDKKNALTYLSAEVQRMKMYETLYISDEEGNYSITSGAPGNISDREYFKKVMSTGETVISDPVVSKATGKYIIAVVAPIKKDGKPIGLIGGTVLLDGLSQRVASIKAGKTGYAYMVRSDGVFISHPNQEYVMKYNPLQDSAAHPKLVEAVNAMIGGATGGTRYVFEGVDKYMGYAPVPGVSWSMGLTVPVDELLEQLSSFAVMSLVMSVTVLIVILVAIMLFANKLVKPLYTLKQQINELAESGGDLTQEIRITSKDEVGDLAEAVNKFLASLRGIITEVNESSTNIAGTSRQLSSHAQQTTVAATESASTVSEIAATIAQVSENTREVAELSENGVKEARLGAQGIKRVIEQMAVIADASNESAKVIESLSNSLGKVNMIVEMITQIAEQTNLLALNAAIEAARAGEQGRGFSVVAEEVRKLAEQSASAAKDIKVLIGQVQHESNRVVEVMSESNKYVQEGTVVVEDVGNNFSVIIDSINKVAQQIQGVASASEQVSSGIQNVAGTTEEQTATMEEVTAATEDLSQMAIGLNQLMRKFKV